MRYVYWMRIKAGRLLIISLSVILYALLLIVNARHFFPHSALNASPLWLSWVYFGFSMFIALKFLAVGDLVWLYAKNRTIALLLFCFCLLMMVVFAVQTSAILNAPVFSMLSGGAGSLALLLFSILLLLFPKNYLSSPSRGQQSQRRYYAVLLLRGYLALLTLLSIIVALHFAFSGLLPLPLSTALNSLASTYDLIALTGILVTIIVSYRQSSSLRERQQRLIFVSGVILSAAPLLLLTVLPQVLHLPFLYVNPQLSTLAISLFPMALGYTILRYQILVFDMYIRRAVTWMVGIVSLAVLTYFVVTLSSVFLHGSVFAHVIFVAIVMAVLGPLVWWGAKVVTERLFFSEMLHYRRLIDQSDMLVSEKFDLDEAARLFTLAAINTFELQEVCLFVLDEETGSYRLSPTLREDGLGEAPHYQLAQRLLCAAQPTMQERIDLLESNAHVVKRVGSAKRPLSLNEACKVDEGLPTGLARYLATTTSLDTTEPLLAPVRAHGKMIGILVLGERGDHQQYAGPDLEAIHLLLSRFSSVLETARLYAAASRHVAVLNALYRVGTMPVKEFEMVEEVAAIYAQVAAEAVRAGAEIWLYHEKDGLLCRVTHAGAGPSITHAGSLAPSQERDWLPYFFSDDNSETDQVFSIVMPPCLQQPPDFPFAWIPLSRGQQRFGLLMLTYPRPHIFSQEEKRVLGMFASQCAVALENAKITIELRAAYERQKELDKLKDQFIMTASHELRTPLTAVLGYIELLKEYNLTLGADARASFIAKAHRGCDELTLMVGNIMDASRVHVDAENVQLREVPLAEAVQHVLEILEAMMRRENRTIQVDIPTHISVMADHLRLRQVLLNLLSNALKYSAAGTGIEISCDVNDGQVTLCIRDHGLGVPLKYQEYLFERFVRLERDMNSPTRGAGLGLYISKQLIKAMGGHIWVESTGVPGSGSTFVFTLKSALKDIQIDGYALERQEV